LNSADEIDAQLYDRLYPRIAKACIDHLASVAGKAPVLELGVGTGRCAGRLAARGIDVVGIDHSATMLRTAQARWPGLKLVRGDIANLPLRGRFRLVVSLVDTLSLLPSIERLRRALRGIADVLAEGGVWVEESWREAEQPAVPSFERHQIPILDSRPGGSKPYAVAYWAISQRDFDGLCRDAGLVLRSRRSTWNADVPTTERMPIVSTYAAG
jgi:SAM-dependent methyltransferase